MNESNVQPMKRSSIYATFGNYYGEKLYKLLYDCCQGVGSFCYEVLKCLGISDQGDSSKFLNQQGEWITINTDGLLRVKVTVTSEEILNSFTTPVELIPSPGVGYYINILDVNELQDFNSIVYNTNTTGNLGYGGINAILYITKLDFLTTSFFKIFPKNNNIEINRPFSFWTEDGNPTDGNSDITYYITYQIVAV